MVGNLVAARSPISLCLSASDIRTHAALEQRVNLFKTKDMYAHSALGLVAHGKIKPLAMSVSVGVHFHIKVIL